MPAPEAPRLRLLQVSAFFRLHGGGIEVVADELAHRLAQQGLQVHWMAGGSADEIPAPSADGNLRVEWAQSFDPLERRLGLPMPLWGPTSLWRLWQAVGAADLVHVHDYLYQPSLAAAMFAALRRRPLVITQHIGEIPLKWPRVGQLLAGLNLHLGSRVLAAAAHTAFVGAPVMQYFQGFGRFRRPPSLIPNGVDLDRFCPTPSADEEAVHDRPVRVLFVGRFVEKKGLLLLRHCLDLPGLDWTFVGSGPLSPLTRPLGHVHVAGRLAGADIADAYRQADLLVLPSTGEGFPLVLQEALASGTPVLVSREVAEAFAQTDARCVFNVELRVDDPVSALRSALQRCTADLSTLRRARGPARDLARQWSWDRCVAAYRALYDAVVAR
jgi:glycosyltransferase involved in cell wall biosynthesis